MKQTASWILEIVKWFIRTPVASTGYVLAAIAIVFAISILSSRSQKAYEEALISRYRADRSAQVVSQLDRQQKQIEDLVHFEGQVDFLRHTVAEKDRYFLCTIQSDELRVLIHRLRIRMPHEFMNPLADQDKSTARDLEAILNRVGSCAIILTHGKHKK